MTQKHHTHQFTGTEEAITVLFCLIDDSYANLNPRGRRYESLKQLSDSEIISLLSRRAGARRPLAYRDLQALKTAFSSSP